LYFKNHLRQSADAFFLGSLWLNKKNNVTFEQRLRNYKLFIINYHILPFQGGWCRATDPPRCGGLACIALSGRGKNNACATIHYSL
jgi:hypothetical protein